MGFMVISQHTKLEQQLDLEPGAATLLGSFCVSLTTLDESVAFFSPTERLLLLLWFTWKNMAHIVSEFTLNKFSTRRKTKFFFCSKF